MILRAAIIVLALFLILFPSDVLAKDEFINLVNPVRISSYIEDPLKSLEAEYLEVKKRNLPATWLVTYAVLKNKEMSEFMKEFEKNQELGIFMEVTPDLAEKANVEYHSSDSWHRARSLFLVGYSSEDRIKLIDSVFNEFKKKFGYFPKSVGAWWIDSYSLEYMSKKYGIIANLGVADQFSTDNYSIWGQYWTMPFYPSKFHSALPSEGANKLNLVTMQWAPRDPINGYGDSISSKFSSQDYLAMGLKDDYLEGLMKKYALKNTNIIGQAVFGLESDLSPGVYSSSYAKQLDLLIKLANQKKIKFLTMENFSKFFMKKFPDKSPSYLIGGEEILGGNKKGYWYQTPKYRLGIIYDRLEKKLSIIDFRVYQQNFREPYYDKVLYENDLIVNVPSVIDTVSDLNSKIVFNNITDLYISRNKNEVIISTPKKKIHLLESSILFENFEKKELKNFASKPYISVNFGKTVSIKIDNEFLSKKDGLTFKELSVESIYFLDRPRIKFIAIFLISIFIFLEVVLFYLVSRKAANTLQPLILVALALLFLMAAYLILEKNSIYYKVSQAELDGIYHLKAKPFGNVLVENSKCLTCLGENLKQNPSYGNKRDYIGILSGKKITYESKLFEISDYKKARDYFKELSAEYIYIAKNKGFNNKLKLSPGDYGIKKFYENSAVQIWEVKN